MKIQATVNGNPITELADPGMRLIDYLRDVLGLTGTKEGCSEGECGACTILVDGVAVTSCTMLAGQIDGHDITTIEGLAQGGELDRIQDAFIRHGAIQCGFCTPGMILSVKSLLLRQPNPSGEEVKRAIEGNLCRCTGYTKIINAVDDLTQGGR